MPEIRLNAVVLPAPLGPISACSVRSAIVRSTPCDRLDAAEALDEGGADSTAPSPWDRRPQERRQRHRAGGAPPSRPPRRLLAERRDQPLADADQPGRREHDEGDEQQAEPEQPVRRDAREKSRNSTKNSAPSAGPRKERMPPITTIASSSPENATEIGSAEVMRLLNSSSMPASPVSPAERTKAAACSGWWRSRGSAPAARSRGSPPAPCRPAIDGSATASAPAIAMTATSA